MNTRQIIQKTVLALGVGLPLAACQASPSYEITESKNVEGLYQVKPGTEQWQRLDSHAAMIGAASVPEAKLKAMSTEQLLDVCLEYPLIIDMLAYDTPRQGFEAVAKQFPGFKELLSRADAGKVALAKYKAIDAMGVLADPDNAAMPHFVVKLAMFELLFAQPAMRSTLSKDEHKQLVAESMRKLREKTDPDNADVYGALSLEATTLVAVRELQRLPIAEMEAEMAAVPELARFAKGDSQISPRVLEVILKYGETAEEKTELFDAMKPEVTP